MATEQTREMIHAYAEALVSSGDFARYLADGVTLELMGTGRRVQGREAVRQFITFIHEEAFRTAIEIKSVAMRRRSRRDRSRVRGHPHWRVRGYPGKCPGRSGSPTPSPTMWRTAESRSLRLYFPLEELLRQIGPARTAVMPQAV